MKKWILSGLMAAFSLIATAQPNDACPNLMKIMEKMNAAPDDLIDLGKPKTSVEKAFFLGQELNSADVYPVQLTLVKNAKHFLYYPDEDALYIADLGSFESANITTEMDKLKNSIEDCLKKSGNKYQTIGNENMIYYVVDLNDKDKSVLAILSNNTQDGKTALALACMHQKTLAKIASE